LKPFLDGEGEALLFEEKTLRGFLGDFSSEDFVKITEIKHKQKLEFLIICLLLKL
jgi:hypothetical protein